VKRLLAVVAGLAIALVGTMAAAAWLSTGGGNGSIAAGSLAAPTGVIGSHTNGNGDVHVSWTASSGTPVPTGYYVVRTATGGAVAPACGSSASNLLTTLSCTDTNVPVGDVTYTVVAAFHAWTRSSAPSAVVTVGRAVQVVEFTSTPATPAYGGSYSPTATGGASGNPIVFGTTTPTVCTISGSTVSFVGVGTCVVTADQAGSTYFEAAQQATQQFQVAKASQTIHVTSTAPTDAVVGGPGYAPTATGGGSGNPVTFSIDATTSTVCSISGGVVTYQHVGTCVVDADQAGNANYLAANTAQQSIAVGKGAQAINFTSASPATANAGTTYAPVATASSGLPVALTVSGACTISSGTVTFGPAAGTCTINANQAGDADFEPAAQKQQSVTVTATKLDQSITFTSTPPSGAQVGGGTYSPTASASSGLQVSFTIDASSSGVCTISGGAVSFTGIGTCRINGNQPGNASYNAAPQVQQSVTVAAVAKPTITSCSRQSGNNKGYVLTWTWPGSGTPNGGFRLSYTNLSSGSISPSSGISSPFTTPDINGTLSGTFSLVAIVSGVSSAPATADFSHTANNSDTCTNIH
jgi:hypothetical protein